MTEEATQYQLQFIPQTDFDEDSYIITKSNRDAINLINSWPHWENGIYKHILCVFGQKFSGKTHLATIWQHKSKALMIDLNSLKAESFFNNNINCYLLEDITKFLSEERQLFVLINHVINSKKFLLITSTIPLTQINFCLPDLKSRINAIMEVEIKKPDEYMVGQILLKYFADRQIVVSSSVIHYLIHRIDRSYYKIAQIVEELDKLSLSKNKKISIPMIKSLLNI